MHRKQARSIRERRRSSVQLRDENCQTCLRLRLSFPDPSVRASGGEPHSTAPPGAPSKAPAQRYISPGRSALSCSVRSRARRASRRVRCPHTPLQPRSVPPAPTPLPGALAEPANGARTRQLAALKLKKKNN